MSAYLQGLVDFIGTYPALAIVAAFIVSTGEALLIIGLFVPSTVVLLGIGGLIGAGRLPFWPIFIATTAGAVVGDAISFWIGYVFKERLTEVACFQRYRKLLSAGQRYFALHGGKSVVIGRFIPGIKSVVPGIAGMMGMGMLRFTLLNILSSIAWAAVHLLPGMSAGLALAKLNSVNTRLAVFLGLAVVVIALSAWGVKLASQLGARILPRLRTALAGWAARRQDRLGYVVERLASPLHGGFRRQSLLIAAIFAAVVAFALLLEDVATGETRPSDYAISQLLQSLRTSLADLVMIAVTMLGDWTVTLAVAAAGCAVLIACRRPGLAIGLLIALGGSMAFVWVAKLAIRAPNPIDIYTGLDAFSFPSGHVAATATLYGALGMIAIRGSGAMLGRATAVACACFVAAVAFSGIYLGAHWPSDVAAGLLFGGGATAGLAMAFRHHAVPAQATARLLAGCVATLLIVGSWHVALGLGRGLSLYEPQLPPAIALSTPWRDGGWRELPSNRIDLAGDPAEPLVLQWRGGAAALRGELMKRGWIAPPAWSINALNGFVSPATSATELPVAPGFNIGRRPVVTLVRPGKGAGREGRLVLSAWPQWAREPDGTVESILVGSISFEYVDHPLHQLSLPRHSKTWRCEVDPSLSTLPGAMLVGSARERPDGFCGDQRILASSPEAASCDYVK
jgi:membrane protein DedA with SNARE-associated domain/membrane-associated phospholipid phosphatase